jgi:tetratricopeptide (TPR) repeat protein
MRSKLKGSVSPMKQASRSIAKRPVQQHRDEKAEKIQILMALVLREYGTEHLAEVERLCLQILALDVRHSDALYILGMSSFKGGRFEVAERMMRRALEVNPQQPFYHFNLSNVLRAQNRNEESLASLERALELKPDMFEGLFNLGNLRMSEKKYEEAIALYKRALAIKPDYVDALCNLGGAGAGERGLLLQPGRCPSCAGQSCRGGEVLQPDDGPQSQALQGLQLPLQCEL